MPKTKKPTPARIGPRVIHIFSDSTGNLPQHMMTAFLTQFPDGAFEVRRHNFLATPAKLTAALAKTTEAPAIIVHAMVEKESKDLIARHVSKHKIPCCDLTGTFVDFLAAASGIAPEHNVRRLHDTTEAYHQRIKALEFTLDHDDGLGLDSLHEADIVLTGVSRTSKTPTSIYLSQQGLRVANVSLAIKVEPPKELLALKKGVVGLVIDPKRLIEIRTTRSVGWRLGDTDYNDPDEVKREINWSRRLFAKHGWPILDVTSRAVEETAGRIVELIKSQT